MTTTGDAQESDLPRSIGRPATRALNGAGIQRLEQLSGYSESNLLRLHGMGPKALGLLRQALQERGLAFAGRQTPAHQSFRTVLRLEGKTATGIQVPAEVVAALGASKKPPVRVTIGGHTYRSTVAAYGDVFMIPVAAEHRNAAGISAGEEVEVTLELDTDPRVVEVPPDLSEALAHDADARRFFDGLSYSNKRRIVLSIEDAKTPETRQRRITKAIENLRVGKA